MSTNKPTTFPTSAAEVTQPVAGAIMHKEYVKTIGRMGYIWGWPIVNSFNRRAGITKFPAEPFCIPVRVLGLIGRMMNNEWAPPDV